MKKVMVKLLAELLKNSKKSDREIAKTMKVSQPTVTRTRNRLVKDGFIQEFTVIPDLPKLGFEILAISSFTAPRNKEMAEKAVKVTMSNPNVIFAARCEGHSMDGVVISIHKDYTDYSNFLSCIMAKGGDDLRDYETLLISLKGLIVKPFSSKYIAELLEK